MIQHPEILSIGKKVLKRSMKLQLYECVYVKSVKRFFIVMIAVYQSGILKASNYGWAIKRSQNGIEIKFMLIMMNYHTTEINLTSACPTHTKYFPFLANWWLICLNSYHLIHSFLYELFTPH